MSLDEVSKLATIITPVVTPLVAYLAWMFRRLEQQVEGISARIDALCERLREQATHVQVLDQWKTDHDRYADERFAEIRQELRRRGWQTFGRKGGSSP